MPTLTQKASRIAQEEREHEQPPARARRRRSRASDRGAPSAAPTRRATASRAMPAGSAAPLLVGVAGHHLDDVEHPLLARAEDLDEHRRAAVEARRVAAVRRSRPSPRPRRPAEAACRRAGSAGPAPRTPRRVAPGCACAAVRPPPPSRGFRRAGRGRSAARLPTTSSKERPWRRRLRSRPRSRSRRAARSTAPRGSRPDSREISSRTCSPSRRRVSSSIRPRPGSSRERDRDHVLEALELEDHGLLGLVGQIVEGVDTCLDLVE